MTAWIAIENIKTDVLYGLFVGHAYLHAISHERCKSWSLAFYPSVKGRRRGIIYHKRNYANCECLTFEIKTIDLINQSKLATIIPREIHVDDEALKHLYTKHSQM